MTYLEGALELMSPSRTHEVEKKLIARLLEAWAYAMEVDLCSFGSTTFRREAKRRGLEPDECYTIGDLEEDAAPQIAIEVMVTSPLIDKLDVYAGLGVQEVWVWHSSTRRLVVNRLTDRRYTEHAASGILPNLDLALLASFVRAGKGGHHALIKGYLASLGR